jgi:hypothetical protein
VFVNVAKSPTSGAELDFATDCGWIIKIANLLVGSHKDVPDHSIVAYPQAYSDEYSSARREIVDSTNVISGRQIPGPVPTHSGLSEAGLFF